MNRRTFVIAGSAGIAAVAIPAWYYLSSKESSVWPKTLALICEADTIVSIGRKYRETFSDEDDMGKLKTLLEPMGGNLEAIAKEDFVAGRTVIVDGWILSRTEARQCAYASLSQPA